MTRERQGIVPSQHYNPNRAIDVGLISIDPESGCGKQEVDPTLPAFFRLSTMQLTLLRILDVEQGLHKTEIAFLYELAPDQNREVSLATRVKKEAPKDDEKQNTYYNNRTAEKDDAARSARIEKIASTIDGAYNGKWHGVVPTEKNIRVFISDLRQKIGYEAIEKTEIGRYRLTPRPVAQSPQKDCYPTIFARIKDGIQVLWNRMTSRA